MDETYTIESIINAVDHLNKTKKKAKKPNPKDKISSNIKIPPQTDLIINQAENYIKKKK